MGADPDVRVYRKDDEEAVVALWNEAFPDAGSWNEARFVIAKKLALQADLFVVAVEDGTVVGTAMGGYDGHRAWLYTVAARVALRRRGIGTALGRVVDHAADLAAVRAKARDLHGEHARRGGVRRRRRDREEHGGRHGYPRM
jgi:predicted N-acetyltransferase YhbS